MAVPIDPGFVRKRPLSGIVGHCRRDSGTSFWKLVRGSSAEPSQANAGVALGWIEWMTVRDLRLLTIAALFSATCLAQTNTVPGEFLVDPPTLVSLGFGWKISGDDNRNARVDVTYRKKGEQQWRTGLPLLRLQHEQVFGGAPRDGGKHFYSYIAPNMFAGSLLNLEPGAEYECRFV